MPPIGSGEGSTYESKQEIGHETLAPAARLDRGPPHSFGGLALVLGRVQAFGGGDRADALQGAVVGLGIGIALTALVASRRHAAGADISGG